MVDYNKVYDVLVEFGGANESARASFVYHYQSERPPKEWRFCGDFGFGGKYWMGTNRISMYKEDESLELRKQMDVVNQKLKEL